MINILQMRSVATPKDVPVSPLNAIAAARKKTFSVIGGYAPNPLELQSFSGTFSTEIISLTSSERVIELSNADIKIYFNSGNLAGAAQSGQIFVDPVKSWFGLVFQIETTIGLGRASMCLLFDYPAKSTFVSLPASSKDTLRDGCLSAAWSRYLRSQVVIPVGNATITTQIS